MNHSLHILISDTHIRKSSVKEQLFYTLIIFMKTEWWCLNISNFRTVFLNWYCEGELWPNILLWCYRYLTAKLLNNHFWYCQSQTHATTVYILSGGQSAEKLKKLIQILRVNTNTCVFNNGWQNLSVFIKIQVHRYLSIESEFNGVSNQIEENLLKSFWIASNIYWNIVVNIEI